MSAGPLLNGRRGRPRSASHSEISDHKGYRRQHEGDGQHVAANSFLGGLAGFGLVNSLFGCGHGVTPSVWGFGGASGRNPGFPARMGGRDRADPHLGSARRPGGGAVFWGSWVASTGLRIPLLTSENGFPLKRAPTSGEA